MGTISNLPPNKKGQGLTVPKESPEDRFVTQYMIDRDPVAAAIRSGVSKLMIEKTVGRWMADANVRQKIQQLTDEADIDTMISPQRILAGFIDVAFDRQANHSARNAALKELAQLKKMYPEKEDIDKSKTYAKNVMFVPAIPSLEDWNAAAMAQQRKLKENVRD